MTSPKLKVFTDISYRDNNAEVGLYHSVLRYERACAETRYGIKIGNNAGLTAIYLEIKTIIIAVDLISRIYTPEAIAEYSETAGNLTYLIISDSLFAIEAASQPNRQNGQSCLRRMNRVAQNLKRRESHQYASNRYQHI